MTVSFFVLSTGPASSNELPSVAELLLDGDLLDRLDGRLSVPEQLILVSRGVFPEQLKSCAFNLDVRRQDCRQNCDPSSHRGIVLRSRPQDIYSASKVFFRFGGATYQHPEHVAGMFGAPLTPSSFWPHEKGRKQVLYK